MIFKNNKPKLDNTTQAVTALEYCYYIITTVLGILLAFIQARYILPFVQACATAEVSIVNPLLYDKANSLLTITNSQHLLDYFNQYDFLLHDLPISIELILFFFLTIELLLRVYTQNSDPYENIFSVRLHNSLMLLTTRVFLVIIVLLSLFGTCKLIPKITPLESNSIPYYKVVKLEDDKLTDVYEIPLSQFEKYKIELNLSELEIPNRIHYIDSLAEETTIYTLVDKQNTKLVYKKLD